MFSVSLDDLRQLFNKIKKSFGLSMVAPKIVHQKRQPLGPTGHRRNRITTNEPNNLR